MLAVYEKLKEKYVLISLYVDDKRALPESEQELVVQLNGSKRKLKTYGNKWSHFEITRFNTNAQPFYVLLTPDGEQALTEPVGYTPDVAEYANFLDCGLNAFDKYQRKQKLIGMNY